MKTELMCLAIFSMMAMASADTRIINGQTYNVIGDDVREINGVVYDVFGALMRVATPINTIMPSARWTCEGNGGMWRYHGAPSSGYSISQAVMGTDALPPAICPTAVPEYGFWG